jgi:predicted ribosomally synthesized peptide with nif11-like leader
MSVQQAKDFLKKMASDPELLKSLEAAPNDEARQEIAKKLGFAFTKDDIRAVANEYKGELSDQDLEAVAGGASAAWVGVGLGAGGAAAGAVGAYAAVSAAAGAAV